MKLKYIVNFNITNLSKSELREFKIDAVTSNAVLNFETENIPRIPNAGEKVTISERIFKVSDYSTEWITDNDTICNIFTVSIYDVEKKLQQDIKEKAEEYKGMVKLFPKMSPSDEYKYKAKKRLSDKLNDVIKIVYMMLTLITYKKHGIFKK